MPRCHANAAMHVHQHMAHEHECHANVTMHVHQLTDYPYLDWPLPTQHVPDNSPQPEVCTEVACPLSQRALRQAEAVVQHRTQDLGDGLPIDLDVVQTSVGICPH